jgi:rubrerythrin
MGIEATKKTEINEDLVENYDFDNTSTDNSSPVSNDFNGDMSAEEAYIELSEFDLEENRENIQPTLDEPLQDEEELPDWLQEMITEPSEPGSEISQPHLEERMEEDEEYIDQMDITQETDISEFAEGTEVSEVEETAEIADVEEIAEINDLDLSPSPGIINFLDPGEDEINSTFNEENIYSPWEDNSQPSKDDEFMFEKSPASEDNDLPKTLLFGKYLLDQKDIDPAIEIFTNYISQSKHLSEIQVWLSETTENEIESKSSVWELIGDIALIKAEPDKALTAYTQAINSLLRAKELTNEAD